MEQQKTRLTTGVSKGFPHCLVRQLLHPASNSNKSAAEILRLAMEEKPSRYFTWVGDGPGRISGKPDSIREEFRLGEELARALDYQG